MGLFGPTTVRCPAGRWTNIIATNFAQLPMSWSVTFRAPSGGAVGGTCEVAASRWIFRGTPAVQPLAASMQFDRGIWNTFFRVRVWPDVDLEATVR